MILTVDTTVLVAVAGGTVGAATVLVKVLLYVLRLGRILEKAQQEQHNVNLTLAKLDKRMLVFEEAQAKRHETEHQRALDALARFERENARMAAEAADHRTQEAARAAVAAALGTGPPGHWPPPGWSHPTPPPVRR